MKNLFTFIAVIFMAGTLMGQAPNSIKYQAALRDSRGNIKANISTNLVIDVLKGSATGTVVFSETHYTNTDGFGLINIEIGTGNSLKGSLGAIDWGNGTYFIRVKVDGVEMGTGQLLSVPYALHATTADKVSGGVYDELTAAKIGNWNTVYGWGNHATAGYLTSFTETDPNVRSVIGMVKSNGVTISAAVPGMDFLLPTGSALALTNFPILNQNTTGNAGTVTTNANLKGMVTSVGNETMVVTNANLTGMVTSSGNETKVVTNANLKGMVMSVGNETTIADNVVTLSMLKDIPAGTLIYRKTDSIGVPELQSIATLKTDLGLYGINSGDQNILQLGGVPISRTVNGHPLSSDVVVTASDVLLGNVANESKATMFTNPTLTGVPLAPTAVVGSNSTQIATTSFVFTAIADASIPDATTLVKGKVQLAGDLTGSADLPIIANGKITTSKISDANVTYAKLQDISATDKVLGRISAGSGIIEEIATTGSGFVVRASSPVLVNPSLGMASVTTLNNLTLTTPATGATLTIADGKTLTVTNNTAISGTNTGDQDISAMTHTNRVALDAVTGVNTGDQTLSSLGALAANASITGATKTKVTYDAKGLVTAGADATTADIAASADKNYVTDAKLTVLNNTTGTNSGDQDLSALATTAATNSALNLKVDKVAGKGLSANDYTTAEQTKLAAITGTNTGDQTISLTGDVTGSGNGSFVTAISDNTISASKLKGSSGALGNGTSGYVLQSDGSGKFGWLNISSGVPVDPNSLLLTDGSLYVGNSGGIATATAKSAVPVSGFGTATANVAMGDGTTNFKITNLLDPSAAQDAATKSYVDTKNATNANLSGDVTSVGNATAISSGVIVNADVNASAAIAGTKINPNFGDQTITLGTATGTTAGTIVLNDATSGTSFTTTLLAPASAAVNRTITLPDATGTVALTTDITSGTATNFSGSLSGDVTGTQGATVVGKINGTSLAGLSTGILKNTTTTGVPTIAIAGTDYLTPTGSAASLTSFPTLNQNTTGTAANVTGVVAVANGGTGQSNPLVAGGVLYGSNTTAAAVTAAGTAGQVLTSNVAGAPTWSSGVALTGDVLVDNTGVSAIQPAKVTLAMMKAMTTNNILLGSGSAGTAVSEITLGTGLSLSGTVLSATGSGGTVTSVSTAAANNGVTATWSVASPTPALTIGLGAITPTSVAATSAVSGTQLTSTVATGTAPLVVTSTTPVANLSIGGNASTATTATNLAGGLGGSIPYQSAAGTTTMLENGAAGLVLRSNGSTLAPTWVSAPSAGTVAGQMLYWNGTLWVTVAPGSTGQVLTFINGVPTWAGTGAGEVKNPTTGAIWMDKNLGATQVATSSTDATSYGDLYQWGRAADGHQLRTSGTTSTLSSSDAPGNVGFIVTSASPFDWRSPQNNDLWQGVNGVNNPCPSGFRLPTEAELNAERVSWVGGNNAAGAFGSPLKFTVAGMPLQQPWFALQCWFRRLLLVEYRDWHLLELPVLRQWQCQCEQRRPGIRLFCSLH